MASIPTTIDVSTEAELDAAIAQVNAEAAGAFVIDLTASITETYVLVNAISLPSGITLSINNGAQTLAGPYALAPAVTINSGSTLTVGPVPAPTSGGTPEMIAFAGIGTTTAVLDIGVPSQFAGTIEGFASGDIVGVSSTINAANTGAGSYNSPTNTTTLTLKNGTATVGTVNLEGDYSAASFNVSGDNVTVVLPSLPMTISGNTLAGTQEIANGVTTTQTGQVTFGSGSDPATIINQGTYDITGAWGISQGAAGSLLINDGTLERAPNGVNGISVISVDVIDTGTLYVPDNTPSGNDTNLRFEGANNSFSGTYIGAGMIDYGNPNAAGIGVSALGTIDMTDAACTTVFGIVDQNGVVTLSHGSTITNLAGATWNFTSDNGLALSASDPGFTAFTNLGTLAKTGGTGTTVIAIGFNNNGFSGGAIDVNSGTLAFDGPNASDGASVFSGAVSGAGTFSLGGGSADQIDSGTTISTAGWTITDAATEVTLNTLLNYSGTFTQQSGAALTLNDNLTLSNATFDGTVTGGSSSEIVFATEGMLHIENLASNVSGSQIQNFNAPIGGFAGGDKLILQGFGEYSTINGISPSSSYNPATKTTSLILTDTNNGKTSTVATLELTGNNYTNASVTPDPLISGAVDLVWCFMAGTMIRTRYGEAAVEKLQRGDLIVSADGRPIPVAWIGRQAVSTRFADPLRVLPIRIMAGALGENVPSRDLLLSPDHAVLVGDVLIQAGALVNGVSILRETNVPQAFTYYHVEVDDHSLILAENTAAETFVDTVSRLSFDNWDEHEALYPEGRPIVEMPYPRAKAYRQIPRSIREQLAARGARLHGIGARTAA
jgi:Hint domain